MVLESNEDGRFVPTYKNAQVLRAVPYDVPQIGYKNGVINNLRLWDVEIPEEYELDYPTLDARRRVKDITAILYPDDSTIEGKELRLVQEYFMTSAGLQTIIKSYLKMGLPLKDIHEKVSVHINDTHPAVAPAEFMRLLLDEYGLSLIHISLVSPINLKGFLVYLHIFQCFNFLIVRSIKASFRKE